MAVMLLVMACIWRLIQQVNVKHITTGLLFSLMSTVGWVSRDAPFS
jgi:hypothetical protein